MLELGSGVGLGGISAARAGAAHVTLSDFADDNAELLDALSANADRNGVPASTMRLDWCDCLDANFKPASMYPVVLGPDLVYPGSSLPALWAAVAKHTTPGGAAYLMCIRRPDMNIAAFPSAHWKATAGPSRTHDGRARRDEQLRRGRPGPPDLSAGTWECRCRSRKRQRMNHEQLDTKCT